MSPSSKTNAESLCDQIEARLERTNPQVRGDPGNRGWDPPRPVRDASVRDVLYPELSWEIVGAAIEVHRRGDSRAGLGDHCRIGASVATPAPNHRIGLELSSVPTPVFWSIWIIWPPRFGPRSTKP